MSRAETDAAEALARELFAGLGPVRSRRMFGGVGLYLDDAMFALIVDGAIYLRTDDALARVLAAAGSAPFVHSSRGTPATMPYWRLPDSALDDPQEALGWARRALPPAEAAAAARRARAARRAAGAIARRPCGPCAGLARTRAAAQAEGHRAWRVASWLRATGR